MTRKMRRIGCRSSEGESFFRQGLQMGSQQPQAYAKLRHSWRQRRIDRQQHKTPRGAKVGRKTAFGEGHRNPGDRNHREQGHLKPGVEEAGGIGGEQAERGETDRVERAAFAP
jgi:hypothetical protein